MKSLKDQIQNDIRDVFFNLDEFSDEVNINGSQLRVIIDDERLQERAEKEFDGITSGRVLYFIPASSFPTRPRVGEMQQFNYRLHEVETVDEAAGVLEIVIYQNRSD